MAEYVVFFLVGRDALLGQVRPDILVHHLLAVAVLAVGAVKLPRGRAAASAAVQAAHVLSRAFPHVVGFADPLQ